MKLIADSGSTSTAWAVIGPDGRGSIISTAGINALHSSDEHINNVLRDAADACPEGITEIHFYGAGCIDADACERIAAPLRKLFPGATVEVATDLLGAARALCQGRPGIACILGTGSNSCLSDGVNIVANVSPLGFILGDEGSGAVIGRRLLGDVLKRQLPEEVCRDFRARFGIDAVTAVRRVYREEAPNRWLGSLAPFATDHIDVPEIRHLVASEFRAFFHRNIAQYTGCRQLPVHFTGSVAWHLQEVLREVAAAEGYTVGRITPSPINALISPCSQK